MNSNLINNLLKISVVMTISSDGTEPPLQFPDVLDVTAFKTKAKDRLSRGQSQG